MRQFVVTVFLFLLAAILPAVPQASPNDSPALPGYSADAARAEQDWESKFRALPDPGKMRDSMQRLAARPHAVGSPYDKDNAEWLLATFKQWGLDARIETFNVLFPTPKERLIELLEPKKFTARLEEPTVPGDSTSGQHSEQLPPYNAYSIDGDVTAPLVYVNYGVPADYEQLDRLGISVKGAIVIARYGESWRGIKPKVAAEHGAIGCIIYSDPRDDGYFEGDVFPKGPFRPRDGVQRGSVEDMPLYPGDPLTPGVGSSSTASTFDLKDAQNLTKIPVLPISYADAQPLLEALTGPVAPENWRGALPLTYHVGPGPAKVHLKVASNWQLKTLYDVIATIPGSAAPDEWVLRGNHHDAWVNGADDPVSGLVAEMEELRGLSELLKQGWKPRRTIVYAAWDGEEPGLLGSTEWAETHADELRRKAVAYINSDNNSRGYLRVSGSHTLEHMVNAVAREVQDPEKRITVWHREQLHRIARAKTSEERQELRQRPDLRIGALGSGSDYTVFLDFLGIASMDVRYDGEAEGGIYHSDYDDYYWYSHFDDSEELYGRALAQTAGSAVLRLADANLVPYDFTDLADTVHRYVSELQKLADDERARIQETNREINEGVFSATRDPKQPYVPPSIEPVPPFLNFAPLQNGAEALTRSAERYQRVLERAQANGGSALAQASLQAVNQKLIDTERALTNPDGLPGRPWFKHQLYAPGFYTGYGVKTIPAVREAIEEKRWGEADRQIVRVGQVLRQEAGAIDDAARALSGATRLDPGN